MADIPEHKTKRLMSLNQDVFAVKADAPAAEQKGDDGARQRPERRTASPASMAQPARPVAHPAPLSGNTGSNKLLLALLGVVVVLVLVVAAGAVAGFHLYERLGAMQEQLAQPDDGLQPLQSRIAALEKSLDAAGQEASKMDGDAQANVLQLTGRVRKVALDLSRLTAELERQKKRVIETSARAERAEDMATEQAGRVDTLSARVAAIPTQTSAPAPSPGSGTDAQARAQVQALQARVDKMANEIRSIYRLLEQTR
jgi:uncharacterized membrane protein